MHQVVPFPESVHGDILQKLIYFITLKIYKLIHLFSPFLLKAVVKLVGKVHQSIPAQTQPLTPTANSALPIDLICMFHWEEPRENPSRKHANSLQKGSSWPMDSNQGRSVCLTAEMFKFNY